MPQHLVSMLDIKDDIFKILDLAAEIKANPKKYHRILANKSLAMIFEKPSTRTRLSFETGMTQLGGHALYLSPKDLQMGRGETIADTAKVMSRYVDIIMYRAFSHDMMKELADNASVPVINALDDLEHPCQIMADLLTIREKKGHFKLKLVYLGDGNNVTNSLLLGCALVGMDMTVSTPTGKEPDTKIFETAVEIGKRTGAEIGMKHDPTEAVKDADVLYTDVWVSMGEEDKDKSVYEPYQINMELIEKAKDEVMIMHCLPAHRGEEITDAAVDSKYSVVFDEAENRLHAQKAIMLYLLGLIE